MSDPDRRRQYQIARKVIIFEINVGYLLLADLRFDSVRSAPMIAIVSDLVLTKNRASRCACFFWAGLYLFFLIKPEFVVSQASMIV